MSWLSNIAKAITGKDTPNFGSFLGSVASSLSGKYLGTQLTGAEKEANEWTAQREDTYHQRTVADMQAAGLNPALMYGNGASGASPSASVAPGSADPMSLIQLAMLPEQLKQMKAQTAQIYADADLKRADKVYRESQTNYQNLLNQYLPERNAAEVAQIWSITNYQEAAAALSWANAQYTDKQAEYYDAFADAKLALEKAQASNFENDAALAKVREEFERIQKNYAAANNVLMSSNEKIALAEYLCGLVGVNPRDAKKVLPDVGKRLDDEAADRKRRQEGKKRAKAAEKTKRQGKVPVMHGSASHAPDGGSR